MNVLLTRAITGVTIMTILNLCVGCSTTPSPSKTIENCYRAVERGDTSAVDLSLLLALFVRPVASESWLAYKSPLTLATRGETESDSGAPHLGCEDVLKAVLKGLYETPEQPVYIEASSVDVFERLILALWTQQWPRLRRSFTFCTGSLANRKNDGNPFDLQVIPSSVATSLYQEKSDPVIIDSNSLQLNEKNSNDSPSWINIASVDMKAKGQLRDFLWRFAGNQSNQRAAFKPLTEVYLCASMVKTGRTPIRKLVNMVSEKFPQQNEAQRLKESLFGATDLTKGLLYPEIPEKLILLELVTAGRQFAQPSSLSIRKRARTLYETEPEEAKQIALQLLSDEINPLGEEFLTGVCESITVDDALSIANIKPNLLPLIIENNPRLVSEPSIWKTQPDTQREIFDILIKNDGEGKESLRQIISILLDAGADALAQDIAAYVGSRIVVYETLNWFEKQVSQDLKSIGPNWYRVLSDNSLSILEWVTQKSDEFAPATGTLALAARILNPHEPAVTSANATIWLKLANCAEKELTASATIDAMSFLLALGFNDPPPSGAELVAKSFPVVYTAAWNQNLSYSNWRFLQNQAPSVSLWRSWDKCERLRYALIARFVRFQWPTACFLQALPDPDTFDRTIDAANETSAGRQFLRTLVTLAAQNNLPANQHQLTTLRHIHISRCL